MSAKKWSADGSLWMPEVLTCPKCKAQEWVISVRAQRVHGLPIYLKCAVCETEFKMNENAGLRKVTRPKEKK